MAFAEALIKEQSERFINCGAALVWGKKEGRERYSERKS